MPLMAFLYLDSKYYLNGYEITNLEGHKGSEISVLLLATFLPEEVVDGLYAAVEIAGLEVANLTLEPIAAMNVAIPENFRLLNIALVDAATGAIKSLEYVSSDGSVITQNSGSGTIRAAHGKKESELTIFFATGKYEVNKR